ncbi:MAG: hypothetical protein WA960_15505 [Tunicatimonas sp.]
MKHTLILVTLLALAAPGHGQNDKGDAKSSPKLGIQTGYDPGVKQRPSYPFRAFLNRFSVNLSTGYGRTFYRHDLSGYNYVRNAQGSYITPGLTGGNLIGYSNWFNAATPATVALGGDEESYKLVPANDGEIAMASGGYSIPVNLAIYFNLFRLRLGGGAMIDFHRANVPEPDNFLTTFPEPDPVGARMFRYYGLLGYSVWEYYDNAIGVDVRVGKINMGRNFAAADATPFVNVGVTLEKVFSEYFRVYLRPAYEYKRYALNLPDATTVNHRNSAFFLTLGVSINYPDLPRSPIKNDRTQMRHYVSDSQGNKKEFRGQPFWRKQDPKIGELYPHLQKTKRKRAAQRRNFFKKKP